MPRMKRSESIKLLIKSTNKHQIAQLRPVSPILEVKRRSVKNKGATVYLTPKNCDFYFFLAAFSLDLARFKICS